ncbi:hypothetical protein BACFRA24663_02350 [Bacteroides fragilis]
MICRTAMVNVFFIDCNEDWYCDFHGTHQFFLINSLRLYRQKIYIKTNIPNKDIHIEQAYKKSLGSVHLF